MHIVARCPATTANLGPGFDCLGMALDLWNEVRVRVRVMPEEEQGQLVTVEGYASGIPLDASNLLVQTAHHAFTLACPEPDRPFPRCRFHLVNRIPPGRGLGSSAAAVVLGLLVGRLLAGKNNGGCLREELLELAAQVEGHADNVAAALFGSVQLCFRIIHPAGRQWAHRPIPPHPRLSQAQAQVCLFIPEEESLTRESRQVLDRVVARDVAVFNAGHVGLLVASILGGQVEDLAEAGRDLLHQPQRAALFLHLEPLLQGFRQAGAWMAWLSGAGSSVAILAPASARVPVEELCRAVQQRRAVAGQLMWLDVSQNGLSWSVDELGL